MSKESILKELFSHVDPAADVEDRYSIKGKNEILLGLKVPVLRDMAKSYKRQHELALELWDTTHDSQKIRETKLLAIFVEDHKQITEKQIEQWVKEFESWEVGDQACSVLFSKTPWAVEKALSWSKRKEEFQKRAGFALMAYLSHKGHKTEDHVFDPFLQRIKEEATDERHYVKKALGWCLREIGKRNKLLNGKAIATAQEIQKMDSKAAQSVAKDALKELTSDKLQSKLSG